MDREARLTRLAAFVLPIAALAACATLPSSLRLEDRPQDNVVRIVNPSDRAVRFHYNYERSFGDYQMFHVRYRDGAGRLIVLDGANPGGWWTPMVMSSQLYPAGRAPTRTLDLRAGETRDVPRGALLASLTAWAHPEAPIIGPCQAQLKLIGYLDRPSAPLLEAVGEWQPAPCPSPN